jgi:exosortase
MATVVNQLPDQAQERAPRNISWLAIGWFFALLVVAYFPILKRLVVQWSTDEDVGHGFFVPLVGAYIAWQRRDRILALELKPAWWGVALMVWGSAQAYVGTLAAELFLQRSAVLIMLLGILLVLGGKELVRELMFPLLLLPFMIPIPAIITTKSLFPYSFLPAA